MSDTRKSSRGRNRQSLYDQTVSVGRRRTQNKRRSTPKKQTVDTSRYRNSESSTLSQTESETGFFDSDDADPSILGESLTEAVDRGRQRQDRASANGAMFGPGRISGREEARRLGEILIRMGVMTESQVDAVLKTQANSRKPVKFGRLARKLGLADRSDVKHALSIQKPSDSRSSDSTAEAIRSLRSQLLIRAKNSNRGSSVAVMSPEKKDGRSFIAGQHTIFNTENTAGFSSLLEGTSNDHPVYTTLDNLYLVPAGPGRANPQDLLCRDEAGQWMDVARDYFDVIVLDTPAANSCSDAEIISSWATQSIVVVRKNVTHGDSIARLRDRMTASGLPITGFVVNE